MQRQIAYCGENRETGKTTKSLKQIPELENKICHLRKSLNQKPHLTEGSMRWALVHLDRCVDDIEGFRDQRFVVTGRFGFIADDRDLSRINAVTDAPDMQIRNSIV